MTMGEAGYIDACTKIVGTAKKIAEAIANGPKKNTQRARTVVFTQGTEPTIAVTAQDGGKVDVKEVAVHAIGEDKIYDTNGAG